MLPTPRVHSSLTIYVAEASACLGAQIQRVRMAQQRIGEHLSVTLLHARR